MTSQAGAVSALQKILDPDLETLEPDPESSELPEYPAFDLVSYNNLEEEMDAQEKQLSDRFSEAWIDFVRGDRPWDGGPARWMRWGEYGAAKVVDEPADENIRGYRRMKQVLQLGEPGETWLQLLRGIDSVVNKRTRMGTGIPLH